MIYYHGEIYISVITENHCCLLCVSCPWHSFNDQEPHQPSVPRFLASSTTSTSLIIVIVLTPFVFVLARPMIVSRVITQEYKAASQRFSLSAAHPSDPTVPRKQGKGLPAVNDSSPRRSQMRRMSWRRIVCFGWVSTTCSFPAVGLTS